MLEDCFPPFSTYLMCSFEASTYSLVEQISVDQFDWMLFL